MDEFHFDGRLPRTKEIKKDKQLNTTENVTAGLWYLYRKGRQGRSGCLIKLPWHRCSKKSPAAAGNLEKRLQLALYPPLAASTSKCEGAICRIKRSFSGFKQAVFLLCSHLWGRKRQR